MTSDARLHHRHTFIGSDRRLARFVARPVNRFLGVEAAGGVLLLAAAVLALIWANSPWSGSYETLWNTELTFSVGSFTMEGSLVHWVNDGLMALFFFVAGMEIKRELVRGDLRDPKAAALPIIGALGGMLVPAVIYLVFNGGTDASHGFGIPVATDIAFAVGVVALLGRRVPPALKVFLLTLAIADDLGGIIIIAVFYAHGLEWTWFAGAVAIFVLIALMRRAHVWYMPLYVALGFAAWLCMYKSGVHATIAGVVLGLLTPSLPLHEGPNPEDIADTLENREDLTAADVRSAAFLINETVPLGDRLIELLHPWTGYVIIPIFALANAGIPLSSDALSSALSSRITIGVFLGLVLGKTFGVYGATWIAAKLRIAVIPAGVNRLQMLAISMAAGIGFTVALFVTELAFEGNEVFQDQAKVGIIAASVVAAVLAAATFSFAGRRAPAEAMAGGDRAEADSISDVEEDLMALPAR